MKRQSISIICCWLGNPSGFVSAGSLNDLYPGDVEIEVVLVDSSIEGNLSKLIVSEHIKLRHIRVPKTNIYNAFNIGVSKASNDWFVFLHEGDQFCKGVDFGKLLSGFNISSPRNSLICCNYAIERRKGLFYERKNRHFRPLRGVMPLHVGIICSRQLWKDLHGFNESIRIASDFDFLIRCYKRKSHFYYSDLLLGFMEGGGASRQKKWVALLEDTNIFIRHFGAWAIFAVILKKLRFISWYVYSGFSGRSLSPDTQQPEPKL